MFEIMHQFWISCFPSWQETFSIGYIIMDFLTIIVFLRILIFEVPNLFNWGGRR